MNTKVAVVTVVGLLVLAIVLLENDERRGPAEGVGRDIDRAAESVSDSLEDVGRNIEDEAEEVRDELKD